MSFQGLNLVKILKRNNMVIMASKKRKTHKILKINIKILKILKTLNNKTNKMIVR
jgi:hypothetical protein